MLGDPYFLVVSVAAVLIAGISKGGFGGGLGLMAVPLMALAIPPVQAAAIMLPVLCLMDGIGLKAYWRQWDAHALKVLAVASFFGIVAGAALFRYTNDDMIRVVVGLMATGFALNHWLRPLRQVEGNRPRPGVAKGLIWGGVAGFTSFAAHAGGPPIGVYLLPQRLPRTVYQATTVAFFAFVNYVKLVPYYWLDQLSGANLTAAAALAPLAFVGMWIGIRLHARVSDGLFYKAAYIFLFATGAKLLWDGAVGLSAAIV